MAKHSHNSRERTRETEKKEIQGEREIERKRGGSRHG